MYVENANRTINSDFSLKISQSIHNPTVYIRQVEGENVFHPLPD